MDDVRLQFSTTGMGADCAGKWRDEHGHRVHPDDLAAWAVAWLATDAGRAAIRAGVRAELRHLVTTAQETGVPMDDLLDMEELTARPAAPREPAQDEPAGVDARAAGFAEGVEAERKRLADKIRDYAHYGSIPGDTRDALLADLAPGSLTPPAAPAALLEGLMAADELLAENGWREDGVVRAPLRAEIARRGRGMSKMPGDRAWDAADRHRREADRLRARLAAAEKERDEARKERDAETEVRKAADERRERAQAREARLAVALEHYACPADCNAGRLRCGVCVRDADGTCGRAAVRALITDGAALAAAIEALVDSRGSTEELCRLVAALRAAWRGA